VTFLDSLTLVEKAGLQEKLKVPTVENIKASGRLSFIGYKETSTNH